MAHQVNCREGLFARVGARSPAPLSRHVDRIMGELALHGKATGVFGLRVISGGGREVVGEERK